LAYIICPHCKYKTPSGYLLCKHCSILLPGAVLPIVQSLALTIFSPDEKQMGGISYELSTTKTSIGRMQDNTIVLWDEEVSRHHATIYRGKDGNYCIEDLNSTNGTFLNGIRLNAPAPVTRGDEIRIGKTILSFADPAEVTSTNIGLPYHPEATYISVGKNISEGSPGTIMSGQTHSENFRPVANDGWALKHIKDEGYYVLKNLHNPVYIKLNERDVHLWKLMDGQHTLRDILMDYLNTFHALGAERLLDLVDELSEKGFLQNSFPHAQLEGSASLKSRGISAIRKTVSFFFQKKFPIQGVDSWLSRLYTHFGWRFYTRTGQIILAAIALFGFVAFILILLQCDFSLFNVQGSVVWGIIFLGLANTVSIFLHEIGHALTAKSYNRQVREVGFMIYFGMPTFFVDTSDIWMEPKNPRIQTSLAGPYISFLIGSITSLILLSSSNHLLNAILFQLAGWSYIIAFFNLNPLLELDGYFILMDLLEIPLLRKRSMQFVRQNLMKKLWKREVFSKEESLFALFGGLSALWSVVAIGLFFFYEAPSIIAILNGNFEGAVSLITIVLLVAIPGLFILIKKHGKKTDPFKTGEIVK
jgi:putative peptide zinc metalloprotease protein